MVLSYAFSDITMQHSTDTELTVFLLKMCHAINTVDPTFAKERSSLNVFYFSFPTASDIRYLCLRPVTKGSVDAKIYYTGADDNFLCWMT